MNLTPTKKLLLCRVRDGRTIYWRVSGNRIGAYTRCAYQLQDDGCLDQSKKGWKLTAKGKKIAKDL